MEVINGYQLVSELKNDKSGFAKWGFARKEGIDFFIKEFLSPIYPLDDTAISPEQILRKRRICNEFEKEKKNFYDKLNQCFTGNVVTVADFFRWGSRYYMVTEKIDATSIDPQHIAKFDLHQKFLIIKIILYGMNILHQHGIVHGDIKPDNILFKRTVKGVYTAKLIDFDSSFTEDNAPTDEDFQGDMVYLAPESFLFIAEEIKELTTKIDVFALGILFHQYFCGELPKFDEEQYSYAFEAILDGAEIKINQDIPEFMKSMIEKMLDKDPEKRPTVNDIFIDVQKYVEQEKLLEKGVTLPVETGVGTERRSSLITTMRTGKEESEPYAGLFGVGIRDEKKDSESVVKRVKPESFFYNPADL